VGEIMSVPFERPRDRRALLDAPEFYALREQLVAFLEDQGHRPPPPRAEARKPSLWSSLRARLNAQRSA
jgi:nitrate/nitrite transport system ATP-binding protein